MRCRLHSDIIPHYLSFLYVRSGVATENGREGGCTGARTSAVCWERQSALRLRRASTYLSLALIARTSQPCTYARTYTGRVIPREYFAQCLAFRGDVGGEGVLRLCACWEKRARTLRGQKPEIENGDAILRVGSLNFISCGIELCAKDTFEFPVIISSRNFCSLLFSIFPDGVSEVGHVFSHEIFAEVSDSQSQSKIVSRQYIYI